MNIAHGSHRARKGPGRTQPPRRYRRAAAGFTMVELVISFGLFLIIASVITLAIGRAFSAAHNAKTHASASSALSSELDKIAHVDYSDLLTGNFTVPDACPGTGSGITGRSCVQVGHQMFTIGYGYQMQAGDASCASTDASRFSASYGYVNVNGCLLGAGTGPYTGTAQASADGYRTQTRQVNAPHAGYQPGTGTVHVTLGGDYTDLPENMLLLIHPATGDRAAAQVSSGTVNAAGIASLSVTNGECTATNVCTLALSVGATPTEAPGPAHTTLALTGTPDAGPDAGFAVPTDGQVEVHANVTATGTATLALDAVKNGATTTNPVAGSVCLWVTFPDEHGQRSVPVCNTNDPGQITLDGYEADWSRYASLDGPALSAALTDTAHRVRYPFPTGVPLTITVDDPDGTCPYVPGMLASQPGSTGGVAGAPDDWAPLAVCTSYTWGEPTHLTLDTPAGPHAAGFTTAGAQLTLTAGQNTTGQIVFDNDTLAPGAVGYGTDPSWAKPRAAMGCSADQSCISPLGTLAADVADPSTGTATATWPNTDCVTDGDCRDAVWRVSPEYRDCPDQYCYSSVNAKPYLASPAGGTWQIYGTTASFPLTLGDPDDAAASITAAVTHAPAGTQLTLGDPTPAGPHTVTYPVTFTDNSGTTALKPVTLTVTSGTGDRQQSTQITLGLYYTGGAWALTAPAVTAAQGDQNVPVPVHVTGTDGTAAAGTDLTFTTTAPGATITAASTDTDGNATGTLAVAANTPAGAYTITATAAGTGRSVTFDLTVTAHTAGISVTLDQTSLPQGGQGTITATATDGAGNPLSGITVRLVATDSATGVPADHVYPAQAGCVTGTDGSCTVTLHVDTDAPAGSYTIGASAGQVAATVQALTVTGVPAKIAATKPINVPAGHDATGTLTVTDGAGDPLPAAAVTVTDGGGLSVTGTPQATDSAGHTTVTLTADPAATLGTTSVHVSASITAPGGPYTTSGTLPVTILSGTPTVTGTNPSIGQGGTGTLTATLTYSDGSPADGTAVSFTAADPHLSVTSSATSDANGAASVTVTAAADTPAGKYTVIATVAGQTSALQVTVTPVAATFTETGALAQGSTGPITVTLTDRAGNVMASVPVTLSGLPQHLTAAASTVDTGSDGTATFTLTDTGSPAGVYQLNVSVPGLTGTIAVPVTSG